MEFGFEVESSRVRLAESGFELPFALRLVLGVLAYFGLAYRLPGWEA